MLQKLFDKTLDRIVDYPKSILLLLVVISGIVLVGYFSPQSFTDWFSPPEIANSNKGQKKTKRETPPDVEAVSLTDSDVILVIDSDNFFTPEGAKALRHVVEELESLDYVRNILWMDKVPILNIFGLPEPLLPSSKASEQQFKVAFKKAQKHPLVGGQLLSDDGKTMLLMIKFDWLFVESDEDCTTNLKEVAQKAAADFPEAKFSFLVTGYVPTYLTIIKAQQKNKLKYQLIGYGMILLMAIILFRGISAVIIVAMAPTLGVFWTLGVIRFFDFQNNPFNDVILPILLSLVGFTDGVHLMIQIRRYRTAGMSRKEAAKAGLHEVGLACALTSLTTAVGLGSLSLAHHEVVRDFGWSCVIGVFLTFIAVVTVIPIACSSWMGRNVHVGHDKGVIDIHLNRISGLIDIVLRHTKGISRIGIFLTVLFIMISLTLRPDEKRASALPTKSEASIALAHMDKAMGGLESSSVKLFWSDEVAKDSPEVLETIREIDELLNSEKLVGHPVSIRNILDALPGEGSASERMSMLDLLPPPLKRAFYTPEYRTAEVSFRVQDLGIAVYGPVFERIEKGLEKINKEHPEFSFDLRGSAVRRSKNLYQIVVDLVTSLGTAAIIILIVLAVAFRSLRIGLISIVPNMFPLAVTGTYLVVTGQSLEVVSVCAFTVCLGIAVDDTIHFLTRFKVEQKKTENDHEAIRNSFIGVGTALIMTTVVLVAGFSTVFFSDMREQRIFAVMSGLTIGSALFGDLIFLPALLARYSKRDPEEFDVPENQSLESDQPDHTG